MLKNYGFKTHIGTHTLRVGTGTAMVVVELVYLVQQEQLEQLNCNRKQQLEFADVVVVLVVA